MPATPRTISRRLLLTGGFGVLAGAAVGGCGADEHHPSVAGGDGTPGPPFPNPVEHRYGATVIPARPERVAALGRGDADVLLALGVRPVVVHDWVGVWPPGVGPWSRPALGGLSPTVLTGAGIDVAAVAAVTPDLVTATRMVAPDRAAWARLNEVAPAVPDPAVPVTWRGRAPYDTTWQEQTTIIAAACARWDDGRRLVAGTEAAIAAVRRDNPGFAGRTVSVAVAAGDRYHAYIRRDDRVRLLEMIGFRNAGRIEHTAPDTYPDPKFHTVLSRTDPSWLDADLTVVFGDGTGLRADRALNGLPSARSGRLLIVDDADLAGAFAIGTAVSIRYALDRFVPMAAKALGG
ncbi:ABC transporter substrate-binding protein [Jidongwangia harbinensis]|uniref:ABC transporter substrate-binding protein n=1 Tax=Jidongwangia harbinensis TaxID=2878561 RepID=UPI001CD9A09A|nr:ABC transporter substrate-binding protein [Jidongwangia harbinensis]MCA2217163.1 ABC transporter substrate-binding protein [Jidongwangia harbinensis]